MVSIFVLRTLVLLPVALGLSEGFDSPVVYWIMKKPVGLTLIALAVGIAWYAFVWNRVRRETLVLIGVAVPGFMFLTLGLLPMHLKEPNRFGLVSFVPGSVQVRDYTGDRRKDNYPRCRCRYNSLGFRDVEPRPQSAGRRRVLVIGDSYVWGDGIPENDQTLGAFLRRRLATVSENFDVVSAAYPGLGLYGYVRFYERLRKALAPEFVVIGYLGDVDFEPFDAQFLLDQVQGNWFVLKLAMNLRVLQHVHEVSSAHRRELIRADRSMKRVKEEFQRLVAYQKKYGTRFIVLNYPGYDDQHLVPEELELLNPPKHLLYPGNRNKYWYAKDTHPKPLLNSVLADLVAKRIVAMSAPLQPDGKGSTLKR